MAFTMRYAVFTSSNLFGCLRGGPGRGVDSAFFLPGGRRTSTPPPYGHAAGARGEGSGDARRARTFAGTPADGIRLPCASRHVLPASPGRATSRAVTPDRLVARRSRRGGNGPLRAPVHFFRRSQMSRSASGGVRPLARFAPAHSAHAFRHRNGRAISPLPGVLSSAWRQVRVRRRMDGCICGRPADHTRCISSIRLPKGSAMSPRT